MQRSQCAPQIAAVSRVQAVGAHDHGHRVPAHVGAQALFDSDVAGAVCFLCRVNGVDVAGVGRERQVNAVLASVFQQLLDQGVGVFSTLTVDHCAERIHPFTGFLAVQVGRAHGVLGNCCHQSLLLLWRNLV